MTINQVLVGAAVATVVTSPVTPSSPGVGNTFTVADDTGYPASGAFVVVWDRGQANEEKVLVASRAGTTFTVSQRGYDGTVASTHTAGQCTCEHALAASVVQSLINHVDDLEADPHSTKLLNNARHDIAARHQFGVGLALGNPAAPPVINVGAAGSAGVGASPARSDHTHRLDVAAAVSVGLANAEGVAATAARSDHTHLLLDNSVVAAKIAAGAVVGGKIAAGGVQAGNIAAGGISAASQFAADVVDQAALALNYVAGTVDGSMASASADAGTVTYGVTFASAPALVGVVAVGSNADLMLTWIGQTGVGVSSAPFRVATRTGGTISLNYRVHWIAIGVIA